MGLYQVLDSHYESLRKPLHMGVYSDMTGNSIVALQLRFGGGKRTFAV